MVFQNEIFRPSNNWTIFANINKLQSSKASSTTMLVFFNNTRIGVTKKLIDQQISSGFPNLNSFTFFVVCFATALCCGLYSPSIKNTIHHFIFLQVSVCWIFFSCWVCTIECTLETHDQRKVKIHFYSSNYFYNRGRQNYPPDALSRFYAETVRHRPKLLL